MGNGPPLYCEQSIAPSAVKAKRVVRRRIVNTVLKRPAAGFAKGPSFVRISDVLRGILRDNPGVKTFTVERIVAAIGDDGFEASLMMFSIPAVVPVPTSLGMVTLPAGAIAGQMAAGSRRIRLPRFIRKRSLSRRALAVAIHSALPILEAAEKIVRPRWSWVNHVIWRRMIAAFMLILVIAIAFPLFGFDWFHATSIFVISLGMAEKDGLAVMLGVAVGLASLAIIAGGLSWRALRSKFIGWIWKLSGKLGLNLLARLLGGLGRTRLAQLLRFRWSSLLLRWNPEKKRAAHPDPIGGRRICRAGAGPPGARGLTAGRFSAPGRPRPGWSAGPRLPTPGGSAPARDVRTRRRCPGSRAAPFAARPAGT